jgi:hypothetical protein
MRGVFRPRHVPETCPVTLIQKHVDPVQSLVFHERQVFPPGYAPKAVRIPIGTSWGDKTHTRPASIRLEKGIRKKLPRRRKAEALTWCNELSWFFAF